MLRYYRSEAEYKNGKPPRGILNFQQCNFEFTCRIVKKEAQMQLKPKGSTRVFNLRCARSDAEEWETAIETSLK